MMRTFDIVRIFALKDLRIALTYRLSFVLGLFTAFYGMLSLFFVSRVIVHSPTVGTSAEYFRFIVIGVTLSNVLRASVMTAASNARRDQTEGTLEMLATQPISPFALALGWSALPVFESIIEGAIIMAVAIPLGFSGFSPDWLSVFIVLVVSIIAFLAIGFLGAALVLAIQQGTGVMGLVVGVMSLTSGTIFPVAVLPEVLKIFTYISPLTYSVRAMRGAMLNGDDLSQLVSGSLGVLLIYSAVLAPVAVCVLKAGFRFARAKGSLSRF